MDLDDLNRMTLAELGRFVAELTRRFGETAAHPLGASMPDDTFQQFAERVLREHDDRMARSERQYEKLTEIALDIAQTQDRIETQTHRLTRVEAELRTLLAETSVRIALNETRITQNETRLANSEAMLQILIDMQRHRNGGQTP